MYVYIYIYIYIYVSLSLSLSLHFHFQLLYSILRVPYSGGSLGLGTLLLYLFALGRLKLG